MNMVITVYSEIRFGLELMRNALTDPVAYSVIKWSIITLLLLLPFFLNKGCKY